MKEKLLTKETTESSLSQSTICENINNLSVSISALSEIDSALMPPETNEKLCEARINLIHGIYILSTHLITEEPV